MVRREFRAGLWLGWLACAAAACTSNANNGNTSMNSVNAAGTGATVSGPVVGGPTAGSTGTVGASGAGATQPPTSAGSSGTSGGGSPMGSSGASAAAGMSATMMTGSAGSPPASSDAGAAPAEPYHDPGSGPWEVVPMSDVMSVCKLDPAKLQAAETTATYPWLIVRYGKLCYQHNAMNFVPTEAWSTTKTLGATVAGMVSYQTRMFASATGDMQGQFLDTDRADKWLPKPLPYNADAKVAHVLAMVAHDPSLAWGQKSFAYDTVGTTEINSISNMLTTAMSQDSARLGTSVSGFTQMFLFDKLGMKNSSWGGLVFAYSWSTDLLDMARVGLLINHFGVYGGERLVDESWIYAQTHPSFEDANTGFGYLSWLNSDSNWMSIDGILKQMPGTPGPCAPVCIHKMYPHGVSESPDCHYEAPWTCDQKYDVGVWNAEGLGGQLIQGHRGLDMVIVARDAQPGGAGPGTSQQVWDALKSAVIGGDPMFMGDETAFCKAYGSNNYAPDLH